MLSEEDFNEELEEKVKLWKDKYIDYDSLNNELDTIIEKNQKEINNQKKLYDNFKSKEIGDTELDNKIISLNKITKNFIDKLDEELNKSHIFYTKKERELYDKINIHFKIYNNKNAINDQKRMDIIRDLDNCAQIARELKNYVYINVASLMRILYKADNKLTKISYNYMQKHLSKNNGNFIYILNFKTMDETIVIIEEMFESIKEDLKKSKYLKNNQEEKNSFNECEENIKDNFNDINYIHEKIFVILSKWEKYLNMSLGLPTSSHNSVFKNTSFIGDNFLYTEEKKNKKPKSLKYIQFKEKKKTNKAINCESRHESEEIFNVNEDDITDFVKISEVNEDTFNVSFGVLFDPSDTFTFRTKDVLSESNYENINLILFLAGFYSYSYCFLIPDIMIYLNKKPGKFSYDKAGNAKEYKNNNNYYALAISIPFLGNIISKYIFEKFINRHYKRILILSLCFMTLYYILSFLGIFINELLIIIKIYNESKNKNIYNEYYDGEYKYYTDSDIFLLIIGRFFLGMSYLKQLCKIYIDIYIPITNQVQVNQKFTIIVYGGYILSLLLNFLHYFKWGLDEKILEDIIFCGSMMYGLSLGYCLIMLLCICLKFKDPNNNIELLNDKMIQLGKEHRLSKGFILDQKDTELAKFHDMNYQKSNISIELSQTNILSNFIMNNRKNFKKKYYNKIFCILLIFLFTSQYINENYLILLSKIITYDIYFKQNRAYTIYFPLLFSLAYCFSYFVQKLYLKYSYFHKMARALLLGVNFLLIIFTLDFLFLCINPQLINDNKEKNKIWFTLYFPLFGYSCIIIFNELYHIICVNLFIRLLPSEKMTFCGIQSSTWLNIITKAARIIPSIIIAFSLRNFKEGVIDYIVDMRIRYKAATLLGMHYDEYYYNFFEINLSTSIIYGIQMLFLLISLFLTLIYFSYLKIKAKNRILNLY